MKADVRKPRPAGNLKGEFYRQSRAWHGYLSAFAFLALIFFAVTGLLLNHPDWFKGQGEKPATEKTVTVAAADLARAKAARDPAPILAQAVAKQVRLRGAYQSGEVIDGLAMIRLEGVTGSSDVEVDMQTGKAEVTLQRADAVTTLNDLHRGKNAGGAWKLVIDLSAIVILALSLVGYVLFFSLRFRLRTSLILTAVSLGGLFAVFVFLVP